MSDFGFQAKNDGGNYLISDKTKTLTFVKKLINFSSARQVIAGFGESYELVYNLHNCPDTPIPFMTLPIDGKSYAL